MRTFWRSLSYMLVVTAVLWIGMRPQFSNPTQNLTTSVVATSFAQPADTPDINAIFDAVNAQRAANGVHPLERNADLAAIAQKRAADMQANHYYAHQNAQGEYFYNQLDPVIYHGVYACENLDLQATLDTQTYVNDWMESTKGHRACLLDGRAAQAGYAVAAVTLPKVKTKQTLYVVVAVHAGAPYPQTAQQ